MLRSTLTAAVLCLASGTAHAQAVPPASGCDLLAVGSDVVRDGLISLSDVLGKNALLWDQADYDRLVDFVRSCEGSTAGGVRINVGVWLRDVETGRRTALPVAIAYGELRRSMEKAGSDGIRYPSCLAVPHAEDGGEADQAALFGRAFMAMTDPDLGRSLDFLNGCKPILVEWSRSSRNLNWRRVETRVDAMMDEALLLQAQRRLWEERPKHASDLLLRRPDGTVVPPTVLSVRTQALVHEFDNWVRSGRFLSDRLTTSLLSQSDAILASPGGEDEDDIMYVDTIRARVQQEVAQQ